MSWSWNTVRVTKTGEAILADLNAGNSTLEITKVVASSDYSSNVVDLTDIVNVRNCKILSTTKGATEEGVNYVMLSVQLDNIGLAEEFKLRSIGIYAKTSGVSERLYIVSQVSSEDGGEQINTPDVTPMTLSYNIYVYLGGNANVNVEATYAGLTPNEQFEELKADYTEFKKYVAESIPNLEGKITEVDNKIPAIVDNLTNTATDVALSANQGKVLNDKKVDKVSGKQLSTNDFTNEHLQKLNGIYNMSNVYIYRYQTLGASVSYNTYSNGVFYDGYVDKSVNYTAEIQYLNVYNESTRVSKVSRKAKSIMLAFTLNPYTDFQQFVEKGYWCCQMTLTLIKDSFPVDDFDLRSFIPQFSYTTHDDSALVDPEFNTGLFNVVRVSDININVELSFKEQPSKEVLVFLNLVNYS